MGDKDLQDFIKFLKEAFSGLGFPRFEEFPKGGETGLKASLFIESQTGYFGYEILYNWGDIIRINRYTKELKNLYKEKIRAEIIVNCGLQPEHKKKINKGDKS